MDDAAKAMGRARLNQMIRTGEAQEIRKRSGLSLRDVAAAIRRDLEASTLLSWEAGLHWPRRQSDIQAWLAILDELRAVMEPEEGEPETVTAGTRGP